jgi:CubicO group peptidase (beta-lactamase class C family)
VNPPSRLAATISSVLVGALCLIQASAAQTDRVDDYIKAEMKKFHLPGLSMVVLKNGQIVTAAGYGFADTDRKIPATPDTVYKIGSISKQFIAAGILLLMQDGRLALDDPVGNFLDGTPQAWKPITIRHLLTHTSGLIRESPGFHPFKVQSDADLIRAAYSKPLLFAPGTKWAYSNAGYVALAEIIARASGQPWTEFIHERIFEPANMSMTFPTNVKPTGASQALGYAGDSNRRKAGDWPAVRPSGAFLSTVLDLAKWDAVLHTDTVLSDAIRKQMWTPVALKDGTSAPYGLGWHVYSRNGRRHVWHGGGLPGFTAYFGRFLDERVTVAVLTNGDDSDTAAIGKGLAALYLTQSTPDDR